MLKILNVDMFDFYDDFHEGVIITDTAGKILYYNSIQAKIDDIEREYAKYSVKLSYLITTTQRRFNMKARKIKEHIYWMGSIA